MKKFCALDFVIIFLTLFLGVFLSLKNAFRSSSKVSVKANGVSYEYSSKSNGVYKVLGLAGETIFEINDGKIRIIDSACPNKICVHQGWSRTLVCLPNNVIIALEDNGEFDAVSE